MEFATFLTPAVIAAVVTAAINLIWSGLVEQRIKYQFDQRIERARHEHELEVAKVRAALERTAVEEVEKLRSELIASTDLVRTLYRKKLDAYRELEELTYRSRNTVRRVIGRPDTAPGAFSVLKSEVTLLEECLYRDRIYLDLDNLFWRVHEYKNLLLHVHNLVDDRGKENQDAAETIKAELQTLSAQIEENYTSIIESLSSQIRSDAVGKTQGHAP